MSRNTNSSHSNDVPDLVIMVLIAFYALPFIGTDELFYMGGSHTLEGGDIVPLFKEV